MGLSKNSLSITRISSLLWSFNELGIYYSMLLFYIVSITEQGTLSIVLLGFLPHKFPSEAPIFT